MFILWGLNQFNYDFVLFWLRVGSRPHDSRQSSFASIPVTFSIDSHTFVSLVESGNSTVSTHSL